MMNTPQKPCRPWFRLICSCETAQRGREWLEGKITTEEMKKHLHHHVNHACPDWTGLFEEVCSSEKKERE